MFLKRTIRKGKVRNFSQINHTFDTLLSHSIRLKARHSSIIENCLFNEKLKKEKFISSNQLISLKNKFKKKTTLLNATLNSTHRYSEIDILRDA
jgi:hypothetical protein